MGIIHTENFAIGLSKRQNRSLVQQEVSFTHGNVGRGGVVVLLRRAGFVASDAVVATGQQHGDASGGHLLQLVVETLVRGVVIIAPILAVTDAVNEYED